MQSIAEMVLPYVPVEQPAFDADPMPFIAAARSQHPWLARTHNAYLVHGYQASKDFLSMDDKMRPGFEGIVERYGAQGTPWARFMEENVGAIAVGSTHTRLRGSIAAAFTPRSVNRYRQQMRKRISELLDEWAPKGRFDFVEFIASYPIAILCDMLHLSTDIVPVILSYLETQGKVFTLQPELLPELYAGYDLIWRFLDDIIIEREKKGQLDPESLLDALIISKNAGTIDDTELKHLLMFMFPGGYDTSRNVLGMTLYTMLTRPDDWERCAADVEFCGKVIDEIMRFAPVATPVRKVMKEFEYDGVFIPEGTFFFVGNIFAGWDPSVYPEADIYNPDRERTINHLGFGRGAHICVGQHLARTQIIEALHLIAQRIKLPKLAGELSWRMIFGTRGPTTFPIEFEIRSVAA